MYPNLYYFFKDCFGVDWQGLKIAAMFGVFVAIAFAIGAWVLTKELKRKQNFFTYTEKQIIIGKPASVLDLITNFFIGFIFGFKIISIPFLKNGIGDPQEYIFSSQGNFLVGIGVGLLAAGLRFYEANKVKLDTPQERTIRLWPHDRVGDIIVFAFVFGFLGAKLFHNLENWNEFIADPMGAIISTSGLTFYGGLICAAIAIIIYARKHKIDVVHMVDAFAPAMMLAYAIGRMGCQFSGDGDWGIINSAFLNEANGTFATPTSQQFHDFIINNHSYYFRQGSGVTAVEQINHLAVQPVSWLPKWMFGYTYPHNVVNDGIKMANCTWEDHCNALPMAVFPTPFYETTISLIFFTVLMFLRNKIKTAGVIFGIYLMMNGFERFWIEKIRVNTVYDIKGFHPTQAEIISTLLFFLGIGIIVWAKKKVAK